MSPTYESPASFGREFSRMPRAQRRAFLVAVTKLTQALREDCNPPNSLRLKRVQGTKDVWELSFSGDGRATFRFGPETRKGETHVVSLRIGRHDILARPE
jgi:hypothetical protein